MQGRFIFRVKMGVAHKKFIMYITLLVHYTLALTCKSALTHYDEENVLFQCREMSIRQVNLFCTFFCVIHRREKDLKYLFLFLTLF